MDILAIIFDTIKNLCVAVICIHSRVLKEQTTSENDDKTSFNLMGCSFLKIST